MRTKLITKICASCIYFLRLKGYLVCSWGKSKTYKILKYNSLDPSIVKKRNCKLCNPSYTCNDFLK